MEKIGYGDPFSIGCLSTDFSLDRLKSRKTDLFSDIHTSLDVPLDSILVTEVPKQAALSLSDLEDLPKVELQNLSDPEFYDNSSDGDSATNDFWKSSAKDIADNDSPALPTWEPFYLVPSDDKTQTRQEPDLHSDSLARSLLLLCQGRSSLFFTWNESLATFVPTNRFPGSNGNSIHKTYSEIIECGAMVHIIRTFVNRIYGARSPISAHIALASSVEEILDVIERHIAGACSSWQTMSQLHSAINNVLPVLKQMYDLIQCCEAQSSDDYTIHAVHDKFWSSRGVSAQMDRFLGAVESRVTRPWLQRFCHRLGLCGAETGRIHPSADDDNDYAKSQLVKDARLSGPVKDITVGLELLGSAIPDHPLVRPSAWGLDVHAYSGNEHFDPDQLLARATQYELDVTEALQKYTSGQEPVRKTSMVVPSDPDVGGQPDQSLDLKESSLYLADLARKCDGMSSVGQNSSESCLSRKSRSLLENDTKQSENSSLLYRSTLDSLIPLVQSQARLVNGSVLRLMIGTLDLQQHLTNLRAFHLFADGVFLQRVETALSDSVPVGHPLRSDSTCQRVGSTAPNLRQQLASILADTHSPKHGTKHASIQGLNFSFRDGAHERLHQTFSAVSIHAWDFLRVHYMLPQPLKAVITASSLAKYDSMSRYLLQLVHIHRVVTHARIAHPTRTQQSYSAICSFAILARHIISTLASHIFTSAITAPWTAFSKCLDELNADLTEEDVTVAYGSLVTTSLSDIASLHENTLAKIERRLFLREEQAHIRAQLEHIFEIVLKGFSCLSNLAKMNDYSSGTQRGVAVAQHKATEEEEQLVETVTELELDLSSAFRKLVNSLRAEGSKHHHSSRGDDQDADEKHDDDDNDNDHKDNDKDDDGKLDDSADKTHKDDSDDDDYETFSALAQMLDWNDRYQRDDLFVDD